MRVWAPWDDVFGTWVNFLETDAWYHVRVVENQVRNFPHRVTHDPYASLDAQYVAVAPLFDTLVATAVIVTRGTSAPVAYIERVAALAPAVMGLFAVVAVFQLTARVFDRRAGLLAALLAAMLPGHFLDRTLVGFVDHHALEAWLAMATLASLAGALGRRPASGAQLGDRDGSGLAALGLRRPARLVSSLRLAGPGVWLGLYLLGWGSGAFLVAIVALWVAVAAVVGGAEDGRRVGQTGAVTAVAALALVLTCQDPELFRYNTQVASLGGLLAVSLVVLAAGWRARLASSPSRAGEGARARRTLIAVAGAAAVAAGAAVVLFPSLVAQVMFDLARFRPDPTRMAVLEARPLFLYSGTWDWAEPWRFFRSGFYLGALATLILAWNAVRTRRLDRLLVVIFTASVFVATIGQNRFGYYLVPAVAVVIGWLCARVLDWGGVPRRDHTSPVVRRLAPLRREAAVVAVVSLAFAPNIVPAAITTTRAGGMPEAWFAALEYLRRETPEPFGSDAYYYARYTRGSPRVGDASDGYTVMNWWDQGYWIVQAAHRVPVSNPTQVRAPNAARFYTATDAAAALRILAEERARYVLADWELPFREASGGALAGRFQSLADWAAVPTAHFYSVCYARAEGGWQPVWIFQEAYYRTMAYRLMVLGGEAARPVNNTWVVRIVPREDATGRRFCEVTERQVFATPDDAKAAAAARGSDFQAVGLTPWQPAFAVDAVGGLRLVKDIRGPHQPAGEAPMVRIFEVVDSGAAPVVQSTW